MKNLFSRTTSGSLGLGLFYLAVCLIIPSNSGRASVIPDDDGKGFTLEFNGHDFFYDKELSGSMKLGDFDNYEMGKGFNFISYEFWNSGVKACFNGYIDETTTDFGFITGSNYSKFSISSYTGKTQYIESIEFDWSDGAYSGGKLDLFGSVASKSPYDSSFRKDADFNGVENDVEFLLDPEDADEGGKTKYIFELPVRYLAFIYDTNTSIYPIPIARFKAFRIHFTSEDPTGKSTFISAFEDDGNSAQEEYYTLEGVKVNPEKASKGIYIRKSAKGTEKIIKN